MIYFFPAVIPFHVSVKKAAQSKIIVPLRLSFIKDMRNTC
jgi:hypothetical protein